LSAERIFVAAAEKCVDEGRWSLASIYMRAANMHSGVRRALIYVSCLECGARVPDGADICPRCGEWI
jgi:ribosomal protein L40E